MKDHEEKIQRRAYEIWEQEGRPQGEDLKHWVKALQEIGAKAASKPRKPATAKKVKSAPKADSKTAAPASVVASDTPAKATRAKSTSSATRH